MDTLPPFATHRVENQPPPFAPRDLWNDDAALREAVRREGGDDFAGQLAAYGVLAGGDIYALSFDAHRDKPRLRSHDAYGRRIDLVEFHPNYHAIMRAAIEHGVAGLSWHDPRPGAHVARAALSYLHHQVEPGTSCPLTMTHAAVPVLRHAPALGEWMRKAAAPHYDGRDIGSGDKAGVTLGMGMTEKQGGSDVRANETVATPIGGPGGDEYELVGHKWFFSAPMSDGFLVLAQAPGGLSCFLMPRWHPHGGKNALRLMRLKDKLGDWSNASSEVEFQGAWAQRIGEEGRGVATIIEMVMLTRLDCMLGSAGEMRMALAQALHHARHRRSFGKPLLDHALMRNVIADLAIESEAATALAIRVAGAIDRAGRDPHEAAFARIATAIGKFWICKRAPAFVNEAQECLGGAGYVEESILPRLYRQAPLNSIWEGSGNIQCLDVLRALAREPEAGRALLTELERARGRHDALDARIDELAPALRGQAPPQEAQMRGWVERLALALQSALLFVADSPSADAFCRSRLGGAHGLGFGTLPADLDFEVIVQRGLPA
ncbi:acyl-CoA dehydrogenase family protein [Lysobacter gummosus]|uniref:Acyl-CoA dehydrogenase family protein n=1 Tax=Lysobacter gummosus TaxID=262324 RepID=A0ABY3XHT9_9GAMM|nr:acyl-CoA dehydrogenase family protein [Lysobacter gummosus]ALN90740.1 acyl-CoA dehydrogenase, C-terminal domain protein [Lysobacter gummosus]UNP31215.1 acyl-CoA dehydrogenase family protein [Lysobacter gummosus]